MTQQPAKRGRPRDPERLRRVVDAAACHFLRDGYEHSSVEAIAAEAGVSKVTVYSYFPTKIALFEAVVAQTTTLLFPALPPEVLDPARPDEALRVIARQMLQLLRDARVIGAFRLLYATAPAQPAACEAFFRAGPAAVCAHVAAYLAAAAQAGSLQIDSPERAADQFVGLFLGESHTRNLLGLGAPTPADDAQQIDANVAFFLRGCCGPLPVSEGTGGLVASLDPCSKKSIREALGDDRAASGP
jgi:TetR/AcrR family transcriptional repressor of mexJK operon